MDSAMMKYSAGQRGGALVDDTGAPAGGGGGTMVADAPAQININGGITQINNEGYIRQDELPSIIAQAGKVGEQRALRKLQMSSSSRRKIGL